MPKKRDLITAWVPILKPIQIGDLYYPIDFEECLASFLDDISHAIIRFSNHITTAKVSVSSPSENIKNDFSFLNSFISNLRHFYTLKIDCEFDPDLKKHPIIYSDKSMSKIKDLGPFFACDLASTLIDILILTSIAMPCRLSTGAGRVFYKEMPLNVINPFRGLSSEQIFSKEQNWPNINRLSLRKTIDWEKRLGLFDSGFATTSMQRGLASLTHVIGNDSAECGETLFWAMQGLESIYCSGKSELRGQLSEKTRILLGPWEDTKNIVGSLYDLRSKFVHGSHNIFKWNNDFEYDSAGWKASTELYNATSLATRLLLATFQKCISLNTVDLQFTYVLKS